jgi:tetratricopeptide (TPR) repeat protein
VLDEESKMLGLNLRVEAKDIPPAPLEMATPLASFSRFIERASLALIEQLGEAIDESLRLRVSAVQRPTNFEAFRQLVQARLAWAKGQHELALAATTSALALDPDLEEAASIEVAVACTVDDAKTARDAFRRWANLALKHQRPLTAAERLQMLGHWLVTRGEWTEARRVYDDACNLYERAHNERGKAQALNNIASLDVMLGKTQTAIQTYRRNLRVFESDPQSQQDTAITLFDLALAHKNLGQHDEALRAIEQALSLARRLKDTHLEAHCLTQRGAIRDDMGQWTQAEADYTQAGRLFDIMGDETGLAIVKSHRALLHRQQGAYAQAESLMLEALSILERQGDQHEKAVLWLNLADLYFAMGMYEQAWEYAERAQEIFKNLKSSWSERGRILLDMLERVPRQAPEMERPLAGELEARGEEFLDETSPSEDEGEGLYNEQDLYDNESDDG